MGPYSNGTWKKRMCLKRPRIVKGPRGIEASDCFGFASMWSMEGRMLMPRMLSEDYNWRPGSVQTGLYHHGTVLSRVPFDARWW